MPALFTFLFKVNIALVLFCLGYYTVLRHLTFYTLNRIYLVAAILFASVYPFININGFVQSHQKFTAPVQYVITQWKAPAVNFVKPLDQPNYWQWAEVAFWTGVLLLAIRLILQLFSLFRLYHNSTPGRVNNYPVRLVSGDISPFSFWRSIYINPDKLSAGDMEKVLEHEHVHVSQWHTLDILLAELSTVFYWFNPGVWLIKKAVRENIEFITDRRILQKGADSKQYQYSLLTVSMAAAGNNLVNHFNISTIKKRIVMMNTKRSSRINLGRYLLVAPAVVILLLAFSISKAEAVKKGFTTTIHSLSKAITNIHVSSNQPQTVKISPEHKPGIQSAAKTVIADTIYHGKSKDGKRTMMITSDKGLDSTGYVINGAKSTRADVLALDPGKIYSLDMVSADIASKYVDFTLEKPQILFVTTDGSEKGMALKERMDKSFSHGVVAGTRNMAIAGSNDIASAPTASTVYSYSVTESGDNAPKTELHISAKPTVATNMKLGDVIVSPEPTEVITIDSNGTEHTNVLYRNKSYFINKKGADNMIYAVKPNYGGTTIDNFHNGVLYIIDGKEASSLKGVSADDIRSITALRDEAAKKYGDKGKNGVIIVTTKKAKE
ncbi:MAG: hypothetical protein JSU01_11755 [Bacteroidetes bacterium]|nr:hypothetical protein [Bacteroidota bacterium]